LGQDATMEVEIEFIAYLNKFKKLKNTS